MAARGAASIRLSDRELDFKCIGPGELDMYISATIMFRVRASGKGRASLKLIVT